MNNEKLTWILILLIALPIFTQDKVGVSKKILRQIDPITITQLTNRNGTLVE